MAIEHPASDALCPRVEQDQLVVDLVDDRERGAMEALRTEDAADPPLDERGRSRDRHDVVEVDLGSRGCRLVERQRHVADQPAVELRAGVVRPDVGVGQGKTGGLGELAGHEVDVRTGIQDEPGMDRPDGCEDHRGVDRLAAPRDEADRRAENRVHGQARGLAT